MMKRIFYSVGIAAVAFVLAFACLPPVTSPAPYVLGVPPVNDERFVRHLDSATIVGVGTLVKVWHAEQYEPLGFFESRKAPQAYIGRIHFEQLFKGTAQRIEVAYFAPQGNAIPITGLVALWIVHFRDVLPLRMCSNLGLTEFGCRGLKEYRLALDFDEDVLPPETAARVARLLGTAP